MSSNISVSVRLRPSNSPAARGDVVSVHGNSVRLSKVSSSSSRESSGGAYSGSKERSEVFSFDRCYANSHNSQEDIYRDIGKQAVESVDDGFNCCIFAYGQTASGKTYTMFGTESSQGLTPRILKSLISRVSSHSMQQVSIKMGYLEIYNEKVRDLLGWRPSSVSVQYELPSLKVREHPVEGVFVQGLTMYALSSYDEVTHYLNQGNKIRSIGSTNINEHSSRSHAIIVVKLSKRSPSMGGDGFSEVSSKLHLIDLAGSERVKNTGATNKRLKEGISINQSLTNLGKTISLLVEYSKLEPQRRQAFHIPYRNSNLTFLLKDSLGGNSKTFMIATISTAAQNFSETRNTLLYASRARKVVNKPVVNQDLSAQIIGDLKKEVECLKRLLAQASLDSKLSTSVGTETSTETPKSDCCAHSQAIRTQLLRDEKAIGDLLNSSSESLSEQCLSPEPTSLDVATHEFGPPFICKTIDLSSSPSGSSLSGMYLLREGETKIGSDSSKVDLFVDNERVADVHCSLFIEDDSATIIRHNSVFLTVNGEHVTSHRFIVHGNEIRLADGAESYTFYFPSQLACRLLRQQRSSSRASLMSPPRSVSSCSSGLSSRPLSHLYVDCSSSVLSFNQSHCSPDEHSRCCSSLPGHSFANDSEHPDNTMHFVDTVDASQQTDLNCCSAVEQLEKLQESLLESCNRGMQEILGKNEAVRLQLECQMDLIRSDNCKMALLEQKLYAEVEEELCSLNKRRQKLSVERIVEQDVVDKETLELERLTRLSRSRQSSTRSASNESVYQSDFGETSSVLASSTSIDGTNRLELIQASTNRQLILSEVQKTIENLACESSKNLQRRLAVQKSILHGQNKLAEIERELSSISEKCSWLCSYCDKLKEYFDAERSSMRSFEKKMGQFCSTKKRELDTREGQLIQTRYKLEKMNKSVRSCPVSPRFRLLTQISGSNARSSAENLWWDNRCDQDPLISPTSYQRSLSSNLLNTQTRNKDESKMFSQSCSIRNVACDDSEIFLNSGARSVSLFDAFSLPNYTSMPSDLHMMKPKSQLVSVSVPRFRRRKSDHNYFHEYQIDVTFRDEAWTVFHRFSALRDVHLALKSKYPELRFLDFPPRKAFGSRLEKVAAERRLQLQQYLQCLVNLCVCGLEQRPEREDIVGVSAVDDGRTTLSKEALIQLLPFLDPGAFSTATQSSFAII